MDVRISHMGDLKDEDYLPMNDEYLIRFVFIGSWFTPFWSRICRNIILQFLSSGKPNKVTPTPSVPTGPLLANMEDGGCHGGHILMRSCWVKMVLLRNHWYRLLTGSHRYLPSPSSVLTKNARNWNLIGMLWSKVRHHSVRDSSILLLLMDEIISPLVLVAYPCLCQYLKFI